MIRSLLLLAALGALAACEPSTGFGTASTGTVAERDAALTGLPPVFVDPTPLDPAAEPLPASVVEAVNGTAETGGAEAVNASGISSEQNFDAVSAERSIESDAQRLAANRARYELIAPTDLPVRPGTNTPNIVEYALRTNNPVGVPIYRRTNLFSAQRAANACARYASPDLAQTDFLSRGGPERDRRGLDPDGDGYACTWDPTPFRAARAAATPSE